VREAHEARSNAVANTFKSDYRRPTVMTNSFRSALPLLALVLACGGGSSSIRAGNMPEGGSFHGIWQSPQYGNMHLCESGAQVVGDYEKDERRGRIQGTIQGDLLRFQWEERREMVVGRPTTTRGRGYFRIAKGQDNDWYFQGEWGHDADETGGGPWNGVRMRRGNPTRCAASDGGGTSGGSNDASWDDEGGSDSYDDSSSGSSDPEPDAALEGLDEY
jgi:hypothetical protein